MEVRPLRPAPRSRGGAGRRCCEDSHRRRRIAFRPWTRSSRLSLPTAWAGAAAGPRRRPGRLLPAAFAFVLSRASSDAAAGAALRPRPPAACRSLGQGPQAGAAQCLRAKRSGRRRHGHGRPSPRFSISAPAPGRRCTTRHAPRRTWTARSPPVGARSAHGMPGPQAPGDEGPGRRLRRRARCEEPRSRGQSRGPLPTVSPCANVANLRAVVAPPDDPATLVAVQSVRERLSRSHALYEAGRYQQGREYMEALKKEADATGYVRSIAEAGQALARPSQPGGTRTGGEGPARCREAGGEGAGLGARGRDPAQSPGQLRARGSCPGESGRSAIRGAGCRACARRRRPAGLGSPRTWAARRETPSHTEEALRHYRHAQELWRKVTGHQVARLRAGPAEYRHYSAEHGPEARGAGRVRRPR